MKSNYDIKYDSKLCYHDIKVTSKYDIRYWHQIIMTDIKLWDQIMISDCEIKLHQFMTSNTPITFFEIKLWNGIVTSDSDKKSSHLIQILNCDIKDDISYYDMNLYHNVTSYVDVIIWATFWWNFRCHNWCHALLSQIVVITWYHHFFSWDNGILIWSRIFISFFEIRFDVVIVIVIHLFVSDFVICCHNLCRNLMSFLASFLMSIYVIIWCQNCIFEWS